VRGKTIEYKREMPARKNEEVIKSLAAVSSLANTAGGDLLIGIEAEAGLRTTHHAKTSPFSKELRPISVSVSDRRYGAGLFILQVVGRVRSAAEAMKSVFQPKPVFSASYFTFLVKVPA
jgi:hypothetical protein